MNIAVHTFFQTGVLGDLGHISRSVNIGTTGSSIINFLSKLHSVCTVAATVCIPTNSTLGIPFLHILACTCLLNN